MTQAADMQIQVISGQTSVEAREIHDWLDAQGISYWRVDGADHGVAVRVGRLTLSGPVAGLKRALQDRLTQDAQS